MNRRKKLLFVTWSFPPLKSIGCVRVANLAVQLDRLGWDVAVITPDSMLWKTTEPEDVLAAKVRASGIKVIPTGHGFRCLAPDFLKSSETPAGLFWRRICRGMARRLDVDIMEGWRRKAERACARFRPGEIDLVLASGPPFIAFEIAAAAARRLKCPYVLDYRDGWTRSNVHGFGAVSTRYCRKETRLIAGAAAVVCVSDSTLSLTAQGADVSTRAKVITNGFDPAEFVCVQRCRNGNASLVHAGALWPPKSTISPVAAALRALEAGEPQLAGYWRFHYYGPTGEHVRAETKAHGVENRTMIHGTVSRTEAITATAGAEVSIVVNVVNPHPTIAEQGVIPAKIYEPMALKVPILLVSPIGSDAEKLLHRAEAGRSFPAQDVQGMAGFLKRTLLGVEKPRFLTAEWEWPNLAARYDALLLEVMGASRFSADN